MKFIYTLLIAFTTCTLYAQSKGVIPAVEYNQVAYTLDDHIFRAEYNLAIQRLNLGSNDMLLITPRLEAVDGSAAHNFSSVLISGSKRHKILKRSESLSGKSIDIPVFVRKKNTSAVIPLQFSAPAQPWMREAKLVFVEEATGCADCGLYTNTREFVLPVQTPYIPEYTLAYITPEAEDVKERSKGYAAKFSYQVGKYDILPNFANNAQVVAEITELINEVKADENLTITGVEITGYASPEGSSASNNRLAENRAKAFAGFLTRQYDIPTNQQNVNWKGEDWEGLKKAVSAANWSEKDALLQVIASTKDEDMRDAAVKRLNNGTTYKTLLADYYPQLRRNELTINFVVKAFDPNEAKAIIRVNPHYLSLNELYLVANSYPKESAEFKEVFDIASRLYPQDAVAQQNAAAAVIETGSLDRAIAILEKQNTPDAWNNLAVVHAKKGNKEKAKELFEKAIKAGHRIAKQNLEELNKTR